MAIKSLPRLIMFFLGMPYRLISFFTVYEALLTNLFTGVCFHTGVAVGVIGET
jgi:hypothetical protein